MIFSKITDNIYSLPADPENFRPAVYVIAGLRKTMVIDAGSTEEHVRLVQEGLNEINRKADYLVLTHYHWDHSFGLSWWPEDVISICNERTLGYLEHLRSLEWSDEALYGRMEREEESEFFARLIKVNYPDLSKIRIALPKRYYVSEEEIDLGGITAQLHYLPGDHSDDSTVVYVPEAKVLFTGDVLAESVKGESWYYTYHKTAAVVERLQQFDADLICESHAEPVNRIYFTDILKQLEKTNEAAKRAIESGDPDSAEEELEKEMNRPLKDEEIELLKSFLYGYYL